MILNNFQVHFLLC